MRARWRGCICGAVPLLLSLFLTMAVGCAGKHPVDALMRQAKRYDATIAHERPQTYQDALFIVPVAHAIDSAARVMASRSLVTAMTATRVEGDWSYVGNTEIGDSGERHTQTRRRTIIEVVPHEVEVGVSVFDVEESRTFGPRGRGTNWEGHQSKSHNPELHRRLQALEVGHLRAVVADARLEELIEVFRASLPSGFIVVQADERSLRAERVDMVTRDRPRRGLSARWERRRVLTVHLDAGVRPSMEEWLEHRFVTEEAAGGWVRASVPTSALRIDWLALAFLRAAPRGLMRFGEVQYSESGLQIAPVSGPPDPPKLRTMAEIREIVTRRAYESRTGNFTVCLNHVLISPRLENGDSWDLPVVDAALRVVSSVAGVAGSVMGELNRIGDADPIIGKVMDSATYAAVAYASGSSDVASRIDRHQVEHIARLTSQVADWTRQILPILPDPEGTFSVYSSTFAIGPANDTLQLAVRQCATADFVQRARPFAVTLYDMDLYEHDLIGQCAFDLRTVIERGVGGIGCGYARLFMSAVYNFSPAQIRVVGLPPAE